MTPFASVHSQAGTLDFSSALEFHMRNFYVPGHLILSTTTDFVRSFHDVETQKKNDLPNPEMFVCTTV